jgi:hypothetical protein
MESEFEISLNMKTSRGIETYACFNLGNDKEFALSLFASLHGAELISKDSIITIDLVKREKGLLFPLSLQHCSYEQLSENVKIITRELFKKLNLERN